MCHTHSARASESVQIIVVTVTTITSCAGVRAALLPLAVRQIQASSGLAMLLHQVRHNIAPMPTVCVASWQAACSYSKNRKLDVLLCIDIA